MTDSQSPGPLVKTWAGSVNWNAPIDEQLDDADAEPDPADERQEQVGQPAVDPERPVPGRIRQRDERERRDADQEDDDPAALEPVPADRRDARARRRPSTRAGRSR